MRTLATLIVTLAFVGSASAAANTYRGTVGNIAIGLELTEPEDDAVVGRYFRFADGVDIPLQARPALAGQFVLAEEGPCDPDSCSRDEDDYDLVTKLPIVATWTLALSADRQQVTGSRLDSDTGEVLQIHLERVGTRVLPPNVEISPNTLHGMAIDAAESDSDAFNATALPYDFLKLDVPLFQGAAQTLDGSRVTYVTDPRTRFAFPQVAALVDGSDVAPVNRALALEHARMSLEALACKSAIYMGFGWDGRQDEYAGTLGFFDEERIQVTYLSPTVMSWNQSGNLFCDGVRGDPHSDSYNLDVRTGTPLDLTKILSGVTARSVSDADASPDPALVRLHPGEYFWQFGGEVERWLLANLAAVDSSPANADCVVDELIAGHVGVHFVSGDRIVFALEHLPSDRFMCARTLVSAPLAEIPDQLVPSVVEFFPPQDSETVVRYPIFAPTAATRAELVPAGWELEADAKGDLDQDGREDLALVLQNPDPGRETMGLAGPRMLIVAFGAADGYDRIIANHQLIQCIADAAADDCFDASSGGLRIEDGQLIVGLDFFAATGNWDMWSKVYFFNWQQDAFELAQFDWYVTNRSSGATTQSNLDYLSHIMTVWRGNIAVDERIATKTVLTPAGAITLAGVGNGMEFDPLGGD